jgi:hypothetical protein
MRISSLLLALLCGLASVCGALDQSRQNSSPRAEVGSFNPELSATTGIIRPTLDLAPGDRLDRDGLRSNSERDGDLTCYTIDSYRVKRESRDSDITEPVGHSTCQRASKYSVKSAEQPVSPRSH